MAISDPKPKKSTNDARNKINNLNLQSSSHINNIAGQTSYKQNYFKNTPNSNNPPSTQPVLIQTNQKFYVQPPEPHKISNYQPLFNKKPQVFENASKLIGKDKNHQLLKTKNCIDSSNLNRSITPKKHS